MMSLFSVVLCCTAVSATDNSEPAPPFDLIEQAFKVLQDKEASTCEDATQIKQTLESIAQRLGNLEGKFGDLEDKVDTMKTRQEAWLSEVRLISLYKLTGENNPSGPANSYNPGLAVDGQFVFSKHHESYMRTYSSTSGVSNSQIWIDLGGLFRVYSVRVWNTRHSSSRRAYFEGTEIYVGDDTRIGELIGIASGAHEFYDFPVSGVKYGTRVTLRQPRDSYINVLEVQVWGNGPYDSTDKFT